MTLIKSTAARFLAAFVCVIAIAYAGVIINDKIWPTVAQIFSDKATTTNVVSGKVMDLEEGCAVAVPTSKGELKKNALKVANRKYQLAKHLAEKYKKPYQAAREVVELAWREAGKHEHVSPELVLAVIQKESSLNANAASSYGAKGYMQVVQRFHAEKLEKNESITDPKVNIRVGAEILQEYAEMKKGNMRDALVKYSGNARGYAEFVLSEEKRLKKIA